MAVLVVDLLEVVHVEEADGKRVLGLGRERLLFELFVEVAVVPEARQRIGEGEPHRLQLPVHRALVERDRDDGAYERCG